MTPVSEVQNVKRISVTTTVFTGATGLLGIFVASVSGSPTIAVSDGANVIVGTFTPVAATWYPLPGKVSTSLIVTIGATVDCSVFWGG